MKLISMRSFVLWIRGMTTIKLCETLPRRFVLPTWSNSVGNHPLPLLALDAQKWDLVGEYAKLIDTLVTLELFVPCGKDGNILEEYTGPPSNWENNEQFAKFTEYNYAKQKVLFEGVWDYENEYFIIDSDNNWIDPAQMGGKTIEDLLQYDLTFTEAVLNRIGI